MSEPTIPGVNVLIWLAVKPIIKLALPSAAGFLLSRSGFLSLAGSRACSQIILNVTLPALMFSKIVPSFTSENVKAIGPIFLVGIVYMLLSFIMGLMIRFFFPTPRNFRYGILAASTWSNWGDLPTSVVQTICLSTPFSGQADADLAVAFVAIFILLFYITLFPMRGTWFIQADYTRIKETSEEEQEGAMAEPSWIGAREKVKMLINRRRKAIEETVDAAREDKEEKLATGSQQAGGFSNLRRQTTSRSIGSHSLRELAGAAAGAAIDDTSEHNRKLSFGRAQLRQAQLQRERLKTIVGSPAQSVFDDDGETTAVSDRRATIGDLAPESVEKDEGLQSVQESTPQRRSRKNDSKFWRFAIEVKTFLRSCITPPTISLICALICALVKPIKALFIDTGYSFHPTAPDGLPPLSILLDVGTFLGNASVPLGLMVLGSALQRMRLPRPLSRLPAASIVSVAIAKLVILPIFGFYFIEALVKHTNLIREDQVVLRFVLTYFSVVPTATTQVALTQIFVEDGQESNSDVLASYLILQYLVFIVSSVILTAFTLNAIF